MKKQTVLNFIGTRRASKLAALDVYVVTPGGRYDGGDVWCLDAMVPEPLADSEGCGVFVFENYDETTRDVMVSFRDWLDDVK